MHHLRYRTKVKNICRKWRKICGGECKLVFLLRIFGRQRTRFLFKRFLKLKLLLLAVVKPFQIAYVAQPDCATCYNAENLHYQGFIRVKPKGEQCIYKERETGDCNYHTY